MRDRVPAAIVTVGTELVRGLRLDTNTAEVAAALWITGYAVAETVSVPDSVDAVARTISRLVDAYPLVVVTGGLGPTHDDVTREAAARALSRPLERDPSLEKALLSRGAGHTDPQARAQMLRQADLVRGARPIVPSVGTAPGQVIATGTSTLVLLPGPPAEMRPMLRQFLGSGHDAAHTRMLRCVGITETDAQLAAQAVLGNTPGIGLTVLATPALVDVVLFDEGADDAALDEAAARIVVALGTACYSTDGSTLAETVLAHARSTGDRLAAAESCTGGMVASTLTDVPGASDVFAGGVVAYSNDVKTSLLGVPPSTLAAHGAVSKETALAMATGALGLGATCAVATTGIAGPTGGSPDKPVGLVWIATASRHSQSTAREYRFPGDRAGVRARATAHALDALRRALLVP